MKLLIVTAFLTLFASFSNAQANNDTSLAGKWRYYIIERINGKYHLDKSQRACLSELIREFHVKAKNQVPLYRSDLATKLETRIKEYLGQEILMEYRRITVGIQQIIVDHLRGKRKSVRMRRVAG